MGNVKNENFITIQGFMINDLHLKGNELLVYAIIYGFSQTEGQRFSGGLQYLADWTSSTKHGIMKNLKSLVDKGLIEKNENTVNGVKFVTYYVTELHGVCNNVTRGYVTELHGGMELSYTNNIYNNNIKNNIDNNMDKHKHGRFQKVLLTDDEYERLAKDYGEDTRDKAIDFLDSYIKEKHYKSYEHNLAIRRWVIKAISEDKSGVRSRIEAIKDW